MSETKTAKQSLPPPPRRRRWVMPILLLLVGVGALVSLNLTRAQVTVQPVVERSWPVSDIRAVLEDKTPELKIFGTIRAAREVELRAQVAGEIVDLAPRFKEGGILITGELLLQIDPADYERAVAEARARLAESEAMLVQIEAQIAQERRLAAYADEELAITKRDLARSEELARSGHVSQKALDDKKLLVLRQEEAVETRKSALKVQRARLVQQEAVRAQRELALNRALRDLADTELKAPFDGWAGNIAAGLGKSVGLQDRLAMLTEAASLEARFIVPDFLFGQITRGGNRLVGRKVQIVWRTGQRSIIYGGEIARLGARIEAGAGGVEAYAAIEGDILQGPLRPGAFVEIYMPGPRYRNVVVIPEEALFETQAGRFVFIIDDEGRLQQKPVIEAGRYGGEIFIAQGIEADSRILTTRFPEAGPGVRVHNPSASAGQAP